MLVGGVCAFGGVCDRDDAQVNKKIDHLFFYAFRLWHSTL